LASAYAWPSISSAIRQGTWWVSWPGISIRPWSTAILEATESNEAEVFTSSASACSLRDSRELPTSMMTRRDAC
jgi:hypothetical protein